MVSVSSIPHYPGTGGTVIFSPGDEQVEDDGEEEGDDVEEHEVGEEHDQVLRGVAAQPEGAGGHVAHALHAHRVGHGEEEPRRAVHDGEDPAGRYYLLSPMQ